MVQTRQQIASNVIPSLPAPEAVHRRRNRTKVKRGVVPNGTTPLFAIASCTELPGRSRSESPFEKSVAASYVYIGTGSGSIIDHIDDQGTMPNSDQHAVALANSSTESQPFVGSIDITITHP